MSIHVKEVKINPVNPIKPIKEENLPRIFFGVPIRNRDWVLPLYLDGLVNLNYPKHLISVFFLVNDSTDETWNQLIDFKEKYNNKYESISLVNQYFGMPEDKRNVGTFDLYPHFAYLKNYMRERFIESGCAYWLHVDSDSPVKSDTLLQMLRHRERYVCGTCNVSRRGDFLSNVMVFKDGKIERASFKELNEVKPGNLFQVHWVGGIALIRRDIALQCKYEVAEPKKDDNFGFCRQIERLGYKIFVDPEVYLEHYMERWMLPKEVDNITNITNITVNITDNITTESESHVIR